MEKRAKRNAFTRASTAKSEQKKEGNRKEDELRGQIDDDMLLS